MPVGRLYDVITPVSRLYDLRTGVDACTTPVTVRWIACTRSSLLVLRPHMHVKIEFLSKLRFLHFCVL